VRRPAPVEATAPPSHTPAIVAEMLQEYGAATRAVLEQYLTADPPVPYLQNLLLDYPRRGGKMMRPSLCIAHARAFGAGVEEAVLAAASIEMMHNALLIHDDIEDGSELRRGRPTLHLLHGVASALHAGDMLMLLSLRPLMDSAARLGERLTLEILRETEVMARETAEGQSLELEWRDRHRTDLTESDYFRMVLKKTAWLSAIHPSRVGSLIGSAGAIDPSIFNRFGFFLGAAFQIQDDVLNLVADAGYGKERNGDLFEGKRTLMLIHAYRSGSAAEQAVLDEILRLPREQRTDEHVSSLREVIDRHGSIDHARIVAQALAGAALHEYSCIYGGLRDSRHKQFIEGLITWVFERSA
jgi:geranylgeranyl diphosphate synthase, type II